MYTQAGLLTRAVWYKELSMKRELLPARTAYEPEQSNLQVTGQPVTVQNAPGSVQGAAQPINASKENAPGSVQGAAQPVNASEENALGIVQGAVQPVNASVENAAGNEEGAGQVFNGNVQDALLSPRSCLQIEHPFGDRDSEARLTME